jgi:hypothetical protein
MINLQIGKFPRSTYNNLPIFMMPVGNNFYKSKADSVLDRGSLKPSVFQWCRVIVPVQLRVGAACQSTLIPYSILYSLHLRHCPLFLPGQHGQKYLPAFSLFSFLSGCNHMGPVPLILQSKLLQKMCQRYLKKLMEQTSEM